VKPFEISRVVDASRDRVWEAWSKVEQFKQWFGPKGFKMIRCTIDFRPGGMLHYCLQMPNGGEMWGKAIYKEIKKPERLVWINSFSDKDGGTTVHPMSPDWPREMHTTVTFEAQGAKKTKITVRWLPVEGSTEGERKTFDEGRSSMNQGWSGTFEQFNEFLAKG
jgi:uncharacterized protein YndB with AHSA1/START domain